MINDRKGQTSNTQLYAEVVFAKKTIPSSPKFFDNDSKKSHLTPSTNYLKKKDKKD